MLFAPKVKRLFSTSSLEFFYKEHFLKNKLPHFKCFSSQIEIFHDPIDYYIELHVKKWFFLKSLIKYKERNQRQLRAYSFEHSLFRNRKSRKISCKKI